MLLQAMRWSHCQVNSGELTFVVILNYNKCVNCAMLQHVDGTIKGGTSATHLRLRRERTRSLSWNSPGSRVWPWERLSPLCCFQLVFSEGWPSQLPELWLVCTSLHPGYKMWPMFRCLSPSPPPATPPQIKIWWGHLTSILRLEGSYEV